MRNNNILAIILASLAILGCTKEYNNSDIPNPKTIDYSNVAIILGEEQPDPYNFQNMVAARDSLANNGVECPINDFKPTGTYVRILCHSDIEEDLIRDDTNIVWFDYPLNYEILQRGSYYVDNTLIDTSLSWIYGVVPIGYVFPNSMVPETIYNVFVPDEHPEYKNYTDYFDTLEYVSNIMCGYTDIGVDSLSKGLSKWNPSATIRVWDDIRQSYIPLDGVKVKVHRKCKTATAITGQNGYCSISKKFKGRVEYSIEWERHYWKILNAKNKLTFLTGPFYNAMWKLDINSGNNADYQRATIHRAAIIANYKSNWTIKRPRKANIFGTKKLKIRYYDSRCNTGINVIGRAYCKNSGDGKSDIDIWGKNQFGSNFSTIEVFNRTIHELAHWSHAFFYGADDYRLVNNFIGESWAQCVDWQITTDEYGNYFSNLGYHDGYQDWNLSTANTNRYYYTPVFIDLIDNHNQSISNSTCPNDNISSYTIKLIQDSILPGVFNSNELKNRLYNHRQRGESNTDIDNLLLLYQSTNGF